MEKANIGIQIADNKFKREAESLVKKLNYPIVDETSDNYDFLLRLDDQGLSLVQLGEFAPGPIRVDFNAPKVNYRRVFGNVHNQMIAKAVGLNRHSSLKVLDATAGLGRDAFVLASLGCYVTLIENSSLIAALLQDGLRRALEQEEIKQIVESMCFIQTDSIDYMRNLQKANWPDVIYIDPMFPQRKKTALVKKEMQVLQKLLAIDDKQNSKELLTIALKRAKKRVVVKRHRLSKSIEGFSPNLQFIGKSCRFDVYQVFD